MNSCYQNVHQATWQKEEKANFCKGKVGSAKAEKEVL